MSGDAAKYSTAGASLAPLKLSGPGSMAQAKLYDENVRLQARITELEASLTTEHYLAQLHQIAESARGDPDPHLAAYGERLWQALGRVTGAQKAITSRLEELGRTEEAVRD